MAYFDHVDVAIEAAFGFGPYDDPDPGDWVDITDYVLNCKYERGSRSSEFDVFNAGTMSLELENKDRRFDPLNLSGPYVGLVDGPNFAVVQSFNTKNGTSLGSSNSMNMPSGIQAGDLLIAMVVVDSTSAVTEASGTWESTSFTWGSAFRGYRFVKLAAGSDTLELSGATEDYACVILRIDGHSVDSVDILSQLGTGVSSDAGTNTNPTCFAPGTGSRSLYIHCTFADDDDNASSPWAHWQVSSSGNLAEQEEIALVESAQSTSSVMVMASYVKALLTRFDPWLGDFDSVTLEHTLAASEEWYSTAMVVPPEQVVDTLLKPDTPIRLTTSEGAVWRGVVDAWPISYLEGGVYSTTEVHCTDSFKTLAERPLNNQAEDLVGLIGSDAAWFKMDRVIDSLYFPNHFADDPKIFLTTKWSEDSSITVVTEKSFVSPPIVGGEVRVPVGAPVLTNPSSAQAALNVNSTELPHNLIGGDTWNLQIVMQSVGSVEPTNLFTLWQYSVPPYGFHNTDGGAAIIVNSGVIEQAHVYIDPGVSEAVITPAYTSVGGPPRINILDGQRHVVKLTRLGDALALTVDEVLLGSDTGLGASTVWSDEQVLGSQHAFCASLWSAGLAASSVPAIAFGSILFQPSSAGGIGSEYWLVPPAPELTGEAIEQVLDLVGWPAALRDIDTGTALVRIPIQLQNETALSLIQKLALSEGGRLFMSADGKVTFQDRQHDFVNNSVEYTFSDTPGVDVGILDEALNWTLDDSYVYTSAEVTREDGQTRRASVEDNPRRTRKIDDLLFASDGQSQSLADWIIYRYAAPQPRTDSWQVNPDVLPSDWPDIISLDIGKRVAIDITPSGQGTSLDLEQIIEQIGGEISPEEWILTFNGVPVDPNDYFFWTSSETSDEVHGWSADGVPPGGAWA